jgi:C-terminal processing protease CtpA/Prc
MPYLVTPGKRPERYLADGESAVLASPDNVRYFESVGWEPAGLVQRLQSAEPGTLVPYSDPNPEDGAEPLGEDLVVASARPRQVAILTDGNTVSAAEAFVLRAMRNEKVTLFGEATGGSIDYQTVQIVRFGCREAGFYLGYPVIVGSDRLPEGGVRPTGIEPDVVIEAAERDPISRILEYYDTRP